MNERQARAEGLVFTGCWARSWNRQKAVNFAKAVRALYGCRAVCAEDDSGVGVYADPKYWEIGRELDGALRVLEAHDEKLIRLQAEYEKKVAEAKEEFHNAYNRMTEITEKYPEFAGKKLAELPDVYGWLKAKNLEY